MNDKLTEKIIGICYDIHNKLGPGFNEKIYQNALKHKLDKANMEYETEKNFNVKFDGKDIESFRTDLIIDDKIILEIKSVDRMLPKIYERQLISYLKAADLKAY